MKIGVNSFGPEGDIPDDIALGVKNAKTAMEAGGNA